jgi:DNA ligase (NAD+)
MDVDRLGWSLIDQLVEKGLLTDLGDVFALPQQRDALLELERMAAKSVDNLLESVERARTSRTFAQLIFGLGIPMVGNVAAQIIAERYRELATLLAVLPDQLREELAQSRGIGPKIADSVAKFFADEHNRHVVQKLAELRVETKPPAPVVKQGPLSGASFCVSGTLSKSREEIHAWIRAHGGEVHERVGKGTSYLVAGDKVGQTKLTAAEKRGAKVLDEAGLLALADAAN